MRRISAMPDVQKRILEMDFIPVGNSGNDFAKDLSVEIQKRGGSRQ